MRRAIISYFNTLTGSEVFQYFIPNYFVMVFLAFVMSSLVAVRFLKRDGFNQRDAIKVIFLGCISALVGAQIFGVIENYPIYFIKPDRILKVWLGGFSMFGGIVSGMLGGFLYMRYKGLNISRFTDAVTPALGIGLVILRTGCFLTGCCYGKVTELPWGIKFPRGSPAFISQFREKIVDIHSKFSLPVHPTQIYEILLGVFLILLSIILLRHKGFDGYVFWFCGIVYFIDRFLIDFLRADLKESFIPIFSITQIMSLIFIILCIFAVIYLWLTKNIEVREKYVKVHN